MRSVATRVLAERSAGEPVASGTEVPARAGVPARRERSKLSRGLWIEPVRFLALLDGVSLATWACATAARLRPALSPPRHPGGAPRTYSDETILLTLLVRRAWCRSLEGMADWLERDAALATALGYPPGGPTISAAQLSRRGRQLGLLVYLLVCLSLVGVLVRLGVIGGTQLVLDATLLPAWSRRDVDAALAGRRGGRATFGYKLHAIVDRASHLPLLVLVTPATVHEVTRAAILLVAVVVLYRLPVWVVYADAAYDSTAFRLLIRRLGASPVIDSILRRRGKRFLATRFFAWQWHRMRAPRTAVERCFAFLKRYYSLTDFRVFGLPAVWQHVLLVHAVMLAIALVAHRAGRPDLITSRPGFWPMSPCEFCKAHTM